jgi:hypothetical protein
VGACRTKASLVRPKQKHFWVLLFIDLMKEEFDDDFWTSCDSWHM